MANRIDNSPGKFLIPGLELGPAAAADPEQLSPAVAGAGQGKASQYADTPSLQGLQDLFDLDRVTPEPSHIGPPPRPLSLQGSTARGSAGESYLPLLRSACAGGAGSTSAPSAEVSRMLDLLSSQGQAGRRILRSRLGNEQA